MGGILPAVTRRKRQLRLLVLLTACILGWSSWAYADGRRSVVVEALDDLTGRPLAGAEVRVAGSPVGTTDDQGRIELRWSAAAEGVEVVAGGYHPERVYPMSDTAPVAARLLPVVLRGRVTDADGRPVAGVQVVTPRAEAVSDSDGRFQVVGAEPGRVLVRRPAWQPTDFDWPGGPGSVEVALTPLTIKAVRVGGEQAGDPVRWEEFLRLVEDTELNGILLDLKDETGRVFYDTGVETAHRVGAVDPRYDLAELAGQLEERGVYLIGRVVAFQDPTAAVRAPEMAVWDTATGSPYRSGHQYFLDPTDPDARAYAMALAEEACRLGVDEVQFDYIRYPDGLRPSARFDLGYEPDTRRTAIRTFLEEAKARLHPMGCAVAADIFGFITTALDDGGIGQQWEEVTKVLDVVSPMLYPSHYGSGWFGLDRPVDHPGTVVAEALDDGLERLPVRVVVRPWLADFGYTPDQVRDQIEEAEERDLGWMLWNAESRFSVSALDPAE